MIFHLTVIIVLLVQQMHIATQREQSFVMDFTNYEELEKQGVKADVVVVDPPRKGLNTDAIEALARIAPRRIVYVSCDPATLARDVALLKERGYALSKVQTADLFPRCAHIESAALLVRADSAI